MIGMYSLPSHLSQSSRDLILRMLVVDPMKRITIPGTHTGIRLMHVQDTKLHLCALRKRHKRRNLESSNFIFNVLFSPTIPHLPSPSLSLSFSYSHVPLLSFFPSLLFSSLPFPSLPFPTRLSHPVHLSLPSISPSSPASSQPPPFLSSSFFLPHPLPPSPPFFILFLLPLPLILFIIQLCRGASTSVVLAQAPLLPCPTP